MMRAVLAVMAGLLCALMGVRRGMAIKDEAARLSRWVQVLQTLSLLVREGTFSMIDAISRSADGKGAVDQLLMGVAAAVRSSPMTTLEQAFCALCGNCREKDAVCRMMQRLCHGSKESRVLAIDQCREEVALMAASAVEKAAKDAKLWCTLGGITGACATIFLL